MSALLALRQQAQSSAQDKAARSAKLQLRAGWTRPTLRSSSKS